MYFRTLEKKECCGCTACLSACPKQCISMVPDEEGFLYPVIDKNLCINCGLCEKVCPVNTPVYDNMNPAVYAAYVKDEKQRMQSTSGAIFYVIANWIIGQGGIVYGAAFDKDFKLKHIGVESLSELQSLRGSKYLQSDLGHTFSEIKGYLEKGRWVYFVGVGCQVAGLHSFLRKEYATLLTSDLVCHGVPSDAVFQAYLSKLSKKKRIDIEGLEFRRLSGWGKATTVKLGNKSRLLYGYDNLYMQAFDKSALFRRSCYSCRYARFPRVGDCTIGDFWGIGRHGTPFRHDVSRGVSLVMANNAKGEKAISGLAGVFIERRTLEEALAENHNIIHPSVKHPQRDKIIRSFLDTSKSLGEIASVYGLVDKSVKGAVKDLMCRLNMYNVAKSVYNKLK